ncbi:hypothetical protein MMC26_001167 [Xylographa opegraphella]|nr:hypothetical protein [Xylographa opegraphella]
MTLRKAAASGYTDVTRKSTVGPPQRNTPSVPIAPLNPSTHPKNAPSTRGTLNPHAFSRNQPVPGSSRAQEAQDNAKLRAQTQYATAQSQLTATPAFRPHPVDVFTPASHRGGRKRHLGPQPDRQWDRQQYEPGMIIIAPLHEAHFDDNIAAKSIAFGDPSTTQSRYGPVYHKARPMIVVTMHDSHYVAISCYIYRGKGLGTKNPDEHLSMHDYRSKEPLEPQTKHVPLEVGYMYDNAEVFSSTSMAHVAYPVCRPYSGKCERIGYLNSASTARLIELYRQTIPPPPSNKAAEDAKLAIIETGRQKVQLTTQTASAAQVNLAMKKITTTVIAQLVKPLKVTLRAKDEQVDALENLLASYEIKDS